MMIRIHIVQGESFIDDAIGFCDRIAREGKQASSVINFIGTSFLARYDVARYFPKPNAIR